LSAIVDAGKASSHFKFSAPLQSVEAMYRAGVTILAGTDANNAEHSPVSVVHGESIHQEMELLVQAGLSTVDALRAATFLPAEVFGLRDRGMIEQGRRADLILIDEDPTEDIRRTRGIRRVWCNGIEVAL
jgi:imidazolonepropionase-like amidohydrolase